MTVDLEVVIVVRPLELADAAQAAQVWEDGLQQTVDLAPSPDRRQMYQDYFAKQVEQERAEDGLMGPHGQGLYQFYINNNENDCHMFVAVRGCDNQVVGLVGVKRGIDYTKFPSQEDEDYKTFSIWKLSVAERRRGIGQKLMAAAEAWVRQQPDARKIRLLTGNPVAASFYLSPKVGFIKTEEYSFYAAYEKEL